MRHYQALTEEEVLNLVEQRLTEEGYHSAVWPDLAEPLARYGIRVLGAWTGTGEIFAVLRANSIRHDAPDADERIRLSGDDAAELTLETVARALARLHQILDDKTWQPGGARLRTFFIRQCLFQFPNVYRRWRRETRLLTLIGDEELAARPDDPGGPDLASRVISRQEAVDELTRMPTDELRYAMQMRADGYPVAQIAATLGVLPKQVENMLGRYRRSRRGGQLP